VVGVTSTARAKGIRPVLVALACVSLTACANVEARPLPVRAHVPNAAEAPGRPAADALETTVRAAVAEWNAAHAAHDRRRLEAVYDTHVRVRGGGVGGTGPLTGPLTLARDALLRVKEADFARSPASVPLVVGVELDRTTPGLPKARVRREVRAVNRIASSELTLTFSCDRARCLVEAEDDDAWTTSGQRAATLLSRPGSCVEALTRLLGSVPDARARLAGRAPETAFVVLSTPPETPVYRFALAALDPGAAAPSAIYELTPRTLEIREALPGDLTQTGDSGAAERAKRACVSR
jgi:hypothetical protein